MAWADVRIPMSQLSPRDLQFVSDRKEALPDGGASREAI
jgi:hypothetical protein